MSTRSLVRGPSRSRLVQPLGLVLLVVACLFFAACQNSTKRGGPPAALNTSWSQVAYEPAARSSPTSGPHVRPLAPSDESNQFFLTEQKATRSTRTVFDGGTAWFSTWWTYAPDDISACLHHARIYFACVREHGQQARYFYLARCSTRDGLDALVNASVGFSSPRNADVSMVDIARITGGWEATYACEVRASELQTACQQGLAVACRHASGTSYALMYPAEYFRGFVAGVDGGSGYGTSPYRTLAERLVGRGTSLAMPAAATNALLQQGTPSTALGLRPAEPLRLPESTRTTVPLPRGVAENGSYYGELNSQGRPKTVRVNGYFRKDGTYVRGHYRSSPRR